MEVINTSYFYSGLRRKKERRPLVGQIELTYRCNLSCIHCYCKGSECEDEELNTGQWKIFFDEIKKEGCLFLVLTGGEPLIRKDFLELYSYVKQKGFIITIFTNGFILNGKILDYLVKSPPFSIEITLNGITRNVYESVSQVEGSFVKVMENIGKIKEKKLPLILKSNCLKQNKNELVQIKSFADNLLGRRKGRYRFKYDPMIYPRLNQDKTPTNFRLSFDELLKLRRQDPDIWREYWRGLDADFPDLKRDKKFLYLCTSWGEQFFINPSGRLKFCNFSERFSVDLRTTPFREGFYQVFSKLLNQKFNTESECRDCRLRPICYYCPARAYLETGNEESPVDYYCELAKGTEEQRLSLDCLTHKP